MIAKTLNKEAVVVDKVDFMRKEIEFTVTVEEETNSLTIVLLFEEADDNICLRTLYGYQVGNGQIEKPIAHDSDISIDWGELLNNELTDWFFTTFVFQSDDINIQIGNDIDDVFGQIWDILEEENLV
ncbi:MAG: hypothetical protein ACW99Q_19600 [Candidatus Kariarchaeaceae archaeon]|jgi:hypothetical protein